MVTKIEIFKSRKEIELPVFIDSRALICANSGGGKSYAIRKILEETHNKILSIVLDVEGEFKTLREKYDFLLIGDDADVSLNPKSAGLLPKKILELEVPTIVDISDLKMNERIRYVKDFLEALLEIPNKSGLWKPCLVVLDEAHLFAGQQEKQDSTHAVIDLMTRGRKRGFCGVLCTQRIAKLHKDAVAEANNYMVGRTGLDIDMKRAGEILGFTSKGDTLSLRDLEPGEFYVFGPAISKHVEKEKIAEVKTTHPKVGMDVRKNIVAPTDKIKAILQRISDLPREQEKELKEKKDFKIKIRELQGEIRHLKSSQPKPEIDQKAIERAFRKGQIEVETRQVSEITNLKRDCRQMEKKIIDIAKITGQETKYSFSEKTLITGPPIKVDYTKERIQKVPKKVLNSDYSVTSPSQDCELGICAKKIYSFLYNNPDREFTKSQVGAMTGYSQKSGGFNNAIYQLNSSGLIERNRGSLKVKEINPDIAESFDFTKRAILNRMALCPRKIYEFLLENQESEFTKEEIAEETGYSVGSGGFNNAIYNLNTLGLIERNGSIIKLNPDLLDLD